MKHVEFLIKQLEDWNLSNAETILALEMVKNYFIQKAVNEHENKKNEPKKPAKRIT